MEEEDAFARRGGGPAGGRYCEEENELEGDTGVAGGGDCSGLEDAVGPGTDVIGVPDPGDVAPLAVELLGGNVGRAATLGLTNGLLGWCKLSSVSLAAKKGFTGRGADVAAEAVEPAAETLLATVAVSICCVTAAGDRSAGLDTSRGS